MNRLNTYAAIGMMAALPLNGMADDPVIKINSRTESAAPQIIVRSIYDFEKSISLKLKTDPAFDVSDVLINTVSKFGMVDARGVRIISGFDVDPKHNLVVGFSGGISEIIKIGQSFYNPTIVASFKGANGNFVSPPKDALAVYDLNGKKLCFDYKDVTQAPQKMVFMLLLDRSASMFTVMDDVKRSADSFLKALPPSAICAVSSFNQGFTYHNERFENCNTGNFKLDSLVADGGTDLFTPLLRAHESLTRPEFSDHQKAVIVITDGQVLPNDTMKQSILSAKKDSLTFAYFLGDSSNEQLKGIANGYLHNPNTIKASIGEYFESLSTAYTTQKVLSIKQCTEGGYAQ